MSVAVFKPVALGSPVLPRIARRSTTPTSAPTLPRLASKTLRLAASRDRDEFSSESSNPFGLPLAATLAAALIAVAATPEEALAARSGGRVGGSSFSSRRAAPPPRAAPRVNSGNTSVYVAPPVYGSPFGFSPFGFSPFGFSPFGPAVGIGFGGIFNIFIAMFVITTVLNIVTRISSKDKDDY
eukprot:CAMPEP_0168609692 /NCGR_PEP_ID=MMETSP0449_2-20121227/1351_1 /TAXON_ID=1082188 /ORGANISM="Strombidium rassoulzadegani, Strain ras09" /LENGTH=182 /DNA_ID=CAMNT_0008649871 /DNA_START=80 /DNA_END=628 /DNA_ORIENTATION=+